MTENNDTRTPPAGDAVERAGTFPRIVSHEQAWQAAKNFIDQHFKNTDGKGVLTSIPARPDDDDVTLADYIKQQRALSTPTPAGAVELLRDGDGIQRIATERARQISEEGWTSEHDAEHGDGELAAAAGCYALNASRPWGSERDPPMDAWPWDASWWKPGGATREGRIRDLEKAGALIAAEIDRLSEQKA